MFLEKVNYKVKATTEKILPFHIYNNQYGNINTKMLASESYYPARGYQIRGNTQNAVYVIYHYE